MINRINRKIEQSYQFKDNRQFKQNGPPDGFIQRAVVLKINGHSIQGPALVAKGNFVLVGGFVRVLGGHVGIAQVADLPALGR